MKHFYVVSFFLLFAVEALAQPNLRVYQDTVFDYFERSADMVEHVANFGGNAPVYQRYVAGTNQNYTEIGMHYDYPSPRDEKGTITKVELLGFRAEIAVNQVMGNADTIPYHCYNADANGFPAGEPIASGILLSGGLQGTTQDYAFSGTDGTVEIANSNGYVIGVETFKQGNDDILVFANNYCVVQGGPNDGRGEKRLKARFVSSGMWENVIDFPAYSFMDCDVLIYPFLRITEVVDNASSVNEQDISSMSLRIAPNIVTDKLNVEILNQNAGATILSLFDHQGKQLLVEEINYAHQTVYEMDLNHLPNGRYKVVVQNRTTTITEDVIIAR